MTNKNLQIIQAITEITELSFVSKEYCMIWLKTYETLYENKSEKKFKLPDVMCRFDAIYGILSWLFSYFEYEQEALKAMDEFSFLNKDQENDVLHWLVQYEKTGMILFVMGFEFFDNDAIIKKDSLQLLEDENIYLALKDFEVLNKFQETHNSLYFEMLEKYTTEEKIVYEFINPDDEFEELVLTEEESDNRSSLKYHLLKRGINYNKPN